MNSYLHPPTTTAPPTTTTTTTTMPPKKTKRWKIFPLNSKPPSRKQKWISIFRRKQSTPSPPPPRPRTTSPPKQAQQASILHFLNLSRSRRLKRTTIVRPKNGFLLSLKGRRRHVARRLSKRRGTGGSVEKRSERSRRGWRRVGLRRWLLRVLTGKRSAGRREIPVTIVT